jgi:hypothetical protein
MLTRTGYYVDNETKVSRRWLKMRKSRFSTEVHDDPEVQAEINKGNIVNILYDRSKY